MKVFLSMAPKLFQSFGRGSCSIGAGRCNVSFRHCWSWQSNYEGDTDLLLLDRPARLRSVEQAHCGTPARLVVHCAGSKNEARRKTGAINCEIRKAGAAPLTRTQPVPAIAWARMQQAPMDNGTCDISVILTLVLLPGESRIGSIWTRKSTTTQYYSIECTVY